MGNVELEVYSYSDPTVKLDTIPVRTDLQVLEELTGPGAGSFKIPKSDRKLSETPTLLDYRNVFKVRVDGKAVGAFLKQGGGSTIIGKDEAGSKNRAVSGEGLKTWLHDSEVEPYGGVRQTSYDTRYFNFASEQGTWYNSSLWVPATSLARQDDVSDSNLHRNGPAEWPDVPDAKWIWDRGNGVAKPLGDAYFRYEFDVTTAGKYSLFFTGDDEVEMYIDGAQIATTTGTGVSWYQQTRVDTTLDVGHHILAARVRNIFYVEAGFIAVLMAYGSADVPTAASVVTKTGDAGWKVLGYPAQAPGWTVGEILISLLNEAAARGVLSAGWMVPSFTKSVDSEGTPWVRDYEWSFGVGADYYDVITKLEDQGFTFRVNPETYTLDAYVNRGVDTTLSVNPVVFEEGRNILGASGEEKADIKNSLLIQTSDGYVKRASPTSQAKYGVIEGSVTTDAGLAEANNVANNAFGVKATPEDSATLTYVAVQGAVPHQDFKVGDWVFAPNNFTSRTKRRVVSIAVSEDAARQAVYSSEFDTIFQTKIELLDRKLQALSDGKSGVQGVTSTSGAKNPGKTTVSTPSQNTAIVPTSPTGLSATTTGKINADGAAYGSVFLSWNPVTTDANGFPVTPAGYEVWGRAAAESDANAAYRRLLSTTSVSTTIEPYNVGISWYYKVRAISPRAALGPFSTEVLANFVGPVLPMLAPTTPVLSTKLGTVTLSWNGKLLSGSSPVAVPPQFDYLYAVYSTASNGTFVPAGPTIGATGDIVITGLDVGTQYYFKTFGVDRQGITSPASPVATIVVKGVANVDIVGEVADSIAANAAAASAAYVAAGNAQSSADAAGVAATTAQTTASLALAGLPNIYPDPSFENLGQGQVSTPVLQSSIVRTGSQAALISSATSYVGAQGVTVVPGQIFQISAWYRTNSSWAGSYGLRILNQSGTSVANANFATTNAGTWTLVTATYTVPASGVTSLTFGLGGTRTAGNMYIDDIVAKDVTDIQGALTAAATAQARADLAFSNAANAATAAGLAQTTANGKNTVWYQNTSPGSSGFKVNDIWFDTNNGNRVNIWNGTSWVASADTAIATAQAAAIAGQAAATAAQTTADGKNKIYTQGTTPTAPTGGFKTGDIWFNSASNNAPSTWNGTAWVTVRDATIAIAQTAANTAQTTADGKNTTYYNSGAPTAPTGGFKTGDLWFDLATGNAASRWSGSAWVSVKDAAIAAAQTTANTALTSANGKNTTYFNSGAPTAPSGGFVTGDLWFDIANGNKSSRWSGTAWVSVVDAAIAAAKAAADAAQVSANTAQTSANGKTTTYYNAGTPTAPTGGFTVGDLWFDTSNGNRQSRWSGSAWVSVVDAAIATAQAAAVAAATAATAAQTTADGKNKIYYQSTSPGTTGNKVGDIWYDSANSNRPATWNGTAWTVIQDATIAVAQAAAVAANTLALTKTKTYTQATSPGTTGNTVGDIWFNTTLGNQPNTWNGTAWVTVQDASIATAQTAATTAGTNASTALTNAATAQTAATNAQAAATAAMLGLNNLYPDPGFENNGVGQLSKPVNIVTTDARSGTKSAYFTQAAGSSFGVLISGVVPGDTYQFSAWTKASTDAAGIGGLRIKPPSGSDYASNNVVASGNTWVKSTLTYTIPASGVTQAQFGWAFALTAGGVWVDDIEVKNITSVKAAVDAAAAAQTTATNAATAAATAATAAGNAQTTANGKNTVWYQNTTPPTSGNKVGDTWFDSGNGNRPNTWNGTAWAPIPDATIAVAQGAATAAQGTANTATTNAANAQAQANAALAAAVANNIVSNGGFENGLTGWETLNNVTVVSTPVNSGTKAASIVWASGSTPEVRWPGIPNVLSKRYRVQYSYNVPTAMTGGVRIVDGTSNAQITALTQNFAHLTADNVWYTETYDFTVPVANTTFKLRFATSSGAFFLDDVALFDITDAYNAQVTATAAATAAGAAQTTANGKNRSWFQGSAPSTVGNNIGDIWFNTSNGNAVSYWTGSAWTLQTFGSAAIADLAITSAKVANNAITVTQIADGAVQAGKVAAGAVSRTNLASAVQTELNGLGTNLTQAQADVITAQNAANAANTAATGAQSTADGKGKIWYQTSAPTPANSNDLWFDTTGGNNIPKQYNGTAWVAVQDASIATAQAAATAAGTAASTAQSAADAANTAASGAQTSANNAATAAATAQTRADNAFTNAATAQTAATNAGTAASAAQTTATNAGTAAANAGTAAANAGTAAAAAAVLAGAAQDGTLNLYPDPSFDNQGSGQSSVPPISTEFSRQGTHSAKVTAATTYTGATINVIPGNTYQLSAWYQTTSDWAGSYGLRMRNITTTTDYANASYATAAQTVWTQVTATYTVAAGITQVRLVLAGTRTAGAIYIDDIIVTDITGTKIATDLANAAGTNAATAITNAATAQTAALAAQAIANNALVGATNIITNSSFEQGLTGWEVEGATATTSRAKTGTQSALITTGIRWPAVATSTTKRWRVTFSYFIASAASNGGIRITDGSTTNTQIAGLTQQFAHLSPDGVWYTDIYDFSTPSGITSFKVRVASTTGNVYLDDVVLYDITDAYQAQLTATAAATAAGNAQTSANGKNRVWYQGTAPSTVGNTVGDTWFNTAAGNAVSQWTGSAWTVAQFGTASIAAGAITAASGIIGSLDAGVITVGTLNSARIAASSITVAQLLITDTTNLVEDPGFEFQAASWTGGGTTVLASAFSITPRLGGTRVLQQTANGTILDKSYSNYIPTQPGDQWYAEAWVTVDSTVTVAPASGSSVQVAATLYKDGVSTSNPSFGIIDPATLVAGTWVKLSGIITIPGGSNQFRLRLSTRNSVTAGIFYWDDVILRKVNDTTTIADGSITTNKVAANSITATKLTVGSLSDNRVPNGSFEDPTLAPWVLGSGGSNNGGTITLVTGQSSSGAQALAIARTSASINAAASLDPLYYIPVTPDGAQKWYLTARVKGAVAQTSGFYLRATWYTAAKVIISSSDAAANLGVTTAWQLFEGQVTPVTNAAYMNVSVFETQASSTLYVDEVAARLVTTTTQIADGAITTGKIVANAVTATQIAANTITAAQIAANTITATQIAANTITATQIAASTITSAQIAAGTITAGNILSGTITATQIAAGTITAASGIIGSLDAGIITTGTLSAARLSAGSITGDKLVAGTITAAQIATGTITAAQLTAGTITSNEIATGTIAAVNIASGAITTVKLAAGAVTANEIAANTITAGNIAAGTITGDRLVANTITATQIAASTITTNEIAANTIAAGNIAAGAITTATLAAGAITAVKIATGTITSNEIAANTITAGNILAATITSAQIAANTITAANIGANVITAGQIAAGTITANELGADSVTSAKILAGTIVASDIATGTITAASGIIGSLDAGVISTGTLNAARIAADSITTDKLTIGDFTNFVDDPSLTNTGTFAAGNSWLRTAGAAANVTAPVTTGAPGVAIRLEGNGASAVTVDNANIFAVTPGATLILGCRIQNSTAGLATYIVKWYDQAGAAGALGNSFGSLAGTGVWTAISTVITVPAGAYYGKLQFSLNAAALAGTFAYYAFPYVRRQVDNVTIADGAVNAAKITALSITAAQIAATTITAAKMVVGTITAASGVIGSLDAGIISTGTLNAARIAAGSISAAQLAVGDFTNYAGDGSFETAGAGMTWSAAGTISSAFAHTGTKSLAVLGTDTSTKVILATARIPVVIGDVVQASIWLYSTDAAGMTAGNHKIRMSDQTTTPVYASVDFMSLPLTGVWTKFTTSFTVSVASTSGAQLQFSFNHSSGTIYADDIQFQKLTSGSLIVNGSITGTQIAATTINSGNIAAGAITTATLAANAITADKIVIGDFTNLLDNPSPTTALGVTGWTPTGATLPTVVTQDGFSAFLLPANGGTITSLNNVTSQPGDQFYMAAWVERNATTPAGTAGGFRVVDGTTGTALTNAIVGSVVSSVAPTVAWLLYEYIFQVPTGVRSLRFQFTNTRTAGSYYVRDIQFRRRSAGNLIVDGSISATQIAASTITAAQIAANTIVAGNIAAGAITTATLAAGAVTAATIAANTITASQIAANTITAANMVAGTITAASGVIGSIDAGTITVGTLNAARIGANSITGGMIAGTTITGANIVGNTITAAQIATGTITAASGIIGSIDAGTITVGSIAAGRIAANTITGTMIAGTTITAANMVAGTITAVSGVVGSLDAGTISTGTLAAARIATGSLDASKITANTITAGQIATGTITANEIAGATITAAKLVANTITATQIATGTITANEIAGGTITAASGVIGSIDAATITVGTLAATRIASNSISVDKITIGDFTNYIDDPTFQNVPNFTISGKASGNSWFRNGSVASNFNVVTDSGAPGTVITIGPATSSTGTMSVLNSNVFPVTPGDKLSWGVRAKNNTNSATRVYLVWMDSTGATSSNAPQTIPVLASTWVNFSRVDTVPAGIAYAQYRFQVETGSTSGIAYFFAPFVRRQVDTVLIQDGAITTAKIVANAVTANEIAAGTITANEISAGAITAAQLTVGLQLPNGSGTNMIPAPMTDGTYWTAVRTGTIVLQPAGAVSASGVATSTAGITLTPTSTLAPYIYVSARNPVPKSRKLYMTYTATVATNVAVHYVTYDSSGASTYSTPSLAADAPYLLPTDAVYYVVLLQTAVSTAATRITSLFVSEVIGNVNGSSNMEISPAGITAKNSGGVVTFEIDATDGSIAATGATFKSAATGARTEVTPSGIRTLDSSGTELVKIGYGISSGMSVLNPVTGTMIALTPSAFIGIVVGYANENVAIPAWINSTQPFNDYPPGAIVTSPIVNTVSWGTHMLVTYGGLFSIPTSAIGAQSALVRVRCLKDSQPVTGADVSGYLDYFAGGYLSLTGTFPFSVTPGASVGFRMQYSCTRGNGDNANISVTQRFVSCVPAA